MNFTFDTITPVRELVMVIQDLYLPRELRGSAAASAELSGLEQVVRFGTRVPLAGGWRERMLRRAGRADLAGVAPACIAGAGLDAVCARRSAGPPEAQSGARWIASALHLRAGLRGVDLDHRGLLRLPAAEQAQLSADFAHAFAPCVLVPLPSGEFLLDTPGIPALPMHEPARGAGSELGELTPSGPAAAPLRRLLAEIEMWLHTQPVNESRRERGAAPLSALWPWGATGRIVCPASGAPAALPLAWGRDAWLEGLWRLQGSVVRPAPQRIEELLGANAPAGVLLVELGEELGDEHDTAADALRRIDARLVAPALAALRGAALERLSVTLNDTCVHLRRGSLRRFWRRKRGGLAGFA